MNNLVRVRERERIYSKPVIQLIIIHCSHYIELVGTSFIEDSTIFAYTVLQSLPIFLYWLAGQYIFLAF